MKPYSILTGELLAKLPTLEACSMDAVFCDPPYGLSFMGKAWDHGVPGPETWAAILRVLKPGAPLLAFGGTRTHHRLMCAIEDAGFEIRDCMIWLYGSGFPKSLDIGKALDKQAGRIGKSTLELKRRLIALVEASGKTGRRIDLECGFRAMNYLTLPAEGKRPDPWVHVLPTADKWAVMRSVLNCGAEMDAAFESAQREVTGTRHKAESFEYPGNNVYQTGGDKITATIEDTAPSTDAAKLWDGYGTALKPAYEPIILAMKPCEGTFAENALKWGVAGLAIDAGRIATGETLNGGAYSGGARPTSAMGCTGEVGGTGSMLEAGSGRLSRDTFAQPLGRWPANVLLDEDAAAALDAQSGFSVSPGKTGRGAGGRNGRFGPIAAQGTVLCPGDSGGASRFFYCAKASRSERGEGNTHPTVKPLKLTEYLSRIILPPERDTPRKLLVPFSGSGSEMIGALNAGWDEVVGIERDPEYAKIARRRLAVSSAPLKRNAAA